MLLPSFHLRFPVADIPHWAGRYDAAYDAHLEREVAPAVRARGYLTHADLVVLGRWKSPRIGPRLASNEPAYVEAVTALALTTAHDRLRIELLSLLAGVAWPMASVILHWCHAEPYPILDYRALGSLGLDTLPAYNFPFWQAYTAHCRDLADEAGVSLRDLDRALWQYSKENP